MLKNLLIDLLNFLILYHRLSHVVLSTQLKFKVVTFCCYS